LFEAQGAVQEAPIAMSDENVTPRIKRRYSRLPYAVALVCMGLFVLAAWLGQNRFKPVTGGQPAPEFQATNMEGEVVRLSDLQGKVVLVNIWATWCAPCRLEMPSMQRLYDEVRSWPGGEDFEILAVSIDAASTNPDGRGLGVTRDDLMDFASELGLTFPIVHDPAGRIQRTYQTVGVPESFLIGRDGLIYRKVAGDTEWDAPQYVEQIRSLLER